MDETERNLRRLIDDIFTTEEDELSCDRALVSMAQSVDMGLDENASRRRFPALWHHFRFCPDCAAEYEMLLSLVQAESEQLLPATLAIPPRPGGKQPTHWRFEHSAITALFSGFSFSQAATRLRSEEGERKAPPINMGPLVIQLGVAPNEEHSGSYDVFCTVTTSDDALLVLLMGTSVWLQQGEEGPVVQEQQLDEFGETHFVTVLPGRYTVRLQIADQTYGLYRVDVP